MSVSNELNSISEVYWLLDRVLEDLGMVKQLLYDKYESYERLFLSSMLTFSGLINDGTEIDSLIKEFKSSRWRAWTWTVSFHLGVLARNYIRKKHGELPNINEIADMFKDITKKLKEFHSEGNLRKTVDALFLEALTLDIATNTLSLDSSKLYTNIEFTSKVVDEYIIKALELPSEHRIKVAYSTLVFHYVFNKTINYGDLRKLLRGPLDSLDNINIEYRTFMLRILTALQMIKERQRVLKSLVDEYKSRFMYTTEKILLRKLIAKLISGNQSKDLNIKYRESEETIILEVTLTEEQIENIAKPNITQLCFIALGLLISGYHNSYTLPLYEQRNYVHFISLIKKIGEDKVQDRLLFLDKLEFDKAFTAFLNEEVWPIFRNRLIYKSILLGGIAGVLDYALLPEIGDIAHSIPGVIIIVLFYHILRGLINITHTKWYEVLNYLFSGKLRQALVESFRDEFYKKLGISR
ncbi:MAG: hypothetical protein GSR85_02300 [Desulfurococcales archaeon]|nr:hypothetical protein [Desulfurococcales archaeon]